MVRGQGQEVGYIAERGGAVVHWALVERGRGKSSHSCEQESWGILSTCMAGE